MRVGINLPQYAIDFEGGSCDPERVLELALAAERWGLDSVWVSDHPFVAGPDGRAYGALEPLAMLGALAARTERIELGTLVLDASMRAAEQTEGAARSLCAIAPGRVTLGIGAGWYEPTHGAYGIALGPIAQRVAGAEAHMAAARRGGARVLAGGTHPALLDATARTADVWNVAWDIAAAQFKEANAAVDAACLRAGRAPSTLARSAGITVVAADDPDDAVARLKARSAFLSDFSTEELCSRIVYGTPDACAMRVSELAADEVIVTLLLRDDMDMLAHFAHEIVPRMRKRE